VYPLPFHGETVGSTLPLEVSSVRTPEPVTVTPLPSEALPNGLFALVGTASVMVMAALAVPVVTSNPAAAARVVIFLYGFIFLYLCF
jgi:hypothetical protein